MTMLLALLARIFFPGFILDALFGKKEAWDDVPLTRRGLTRAEPYDPYSW